MQRCGTVRAGYDVASTDRGRFGGEPRNQTITTYQCTNPNDGKTSKTFPELTNLELESKLATAATCFNEWRQMPIAARATIVAKAAALMHAHVDDFACPVTLEMGKLIAEARGEVSLSADILAYYAKNAKAFLATKALMPAEGEAQIGSAPLGVLFGVEPWLNASECSDPRDR